jgi:hypothetical protein
MESSAKKRKPSAVSVFEEAKPKRQLTIRERQQIIDLVESGKKHCEVRDMCPVQLTPNAIGFIMKNKMRYKSITDETTLDRAPSRDRRLTESGKIIDVHMKKWLDDMLKDGKTVTGPMMRTRAKEVRMNIVNDMAPYFLSPYILLSCSLRYLHDHNQYDTLIC